MIERVQSLGQTVTVVIGCGRDCVSIATRLLWDCNMKKVIQPKVDLNDEELDQVQGGKGGTRGLITLPDAQEVKKPATDSFKAGADLQN